MLTLYKQPIRINCYTTIVYILLFYFSFIYIIYSIILYSIILLFYYSIILLFLSVLILKLLNYSMLIHTKIIESRLKERSFQEEMNCFGKNQIPILVWSSPNGIISHTLNIRSHYGIITIRFLY
jgi:hypothetical protein